MSTKLSYIYKNNYTLLSGEKVLLIIKIDKILFQQVSALNTENDEIAYMHICCLIFYSFYFALIIIFNSKNKRNARIVQKTKIL